MPEHKRKDKRIKNKKILTTTYLLPALLLLTAVLPASGQQPADSSLTLCFTGDIMLGRGVKRFSDKQGAGYPFVAVCSLLSRADLAIGNLESPLTSREYKSTSPWHFRGDTGVAANELRKAGIDLVSLANNHTLDCGPEGLLQCTEMLDSAGIFYGGLAGISADSVGDTVKWCRPAFVRVKGRKIGLVAFCEPYLLEIAKDHGAELVAPAESTCVVRSISAIRDSCDLVIASFHWGQEYKEQPARIQKKLGRLAIDCGAKIVHGHHPHVLQGVEFYKNGLIAYSLGNFIFDQKNQPCKESALLFINRSGDSLRSVFMVPLEIKDNRPLPAGTKAGKSINARLKRLCLKLRTVVAADSNGFLQLMPVGKTPK
jgi:poly-gamma-glutamate synthesis protein (capsule biosynthesis protein)